jgi:hypothetical protein
MSYSSQQVPMLQMMQHCLNPAFDRKQRYGEMGPRERCIADLSMIYQNEQPTVIRSPETSAAVLKLQLKAMCMDEVGK